MHVLLIAGSTRRQSLNARLAHLAAELLPDLDVTRVSDLDRLPFYDGDVEAHGDPEAVTRLRAAVAQADLVVFVTPEYNGTVPGILGNAVDWLSRPPRASVLNGKPALVLSASPTPSGARRAAEHLRDVLQRIGAQVHRDGLSVAGAHARLGIGSAPDPGLIADLAELLDGVLDRRPRAVPA